jgi:hypothetical protein
MADLTVSTNLSQTTADVTANKGNRDKGALHFRYPENLGRPPFDKWIFFEARSGRHVVRDQVISEAGGVDRTLASVGLYLSETTLKNTLNITYDTTALGPFVGAIVELFAQSGRNLMDTLPTLGTDWVGTLKQALSPGEWNLQGAKDAVGGALSTAGRNLKDVTGRAAKVPLGELIGADVLKGVNDLSAGAGSALFGKRPNPRTDVLFDTQNYREYEFSFLMVPRNIREAQAIDNIIRVFQFYMLPKYDTMDAQTKIGGFMLGFPYEFEITLRDGNARELDHVNKFERTVLTNVMVDHAAGGKTAFVKDDNGIFWPVATQITLQFKEVRLLDRNSEVILRSGGNGVFGPGNQMLLDPKT